ncbi:MAG: TadE/TadG family type IV pilus assembly protein [Cellulomonadaceae bacterium]
MIARGRRLWGRQDERGSAAVEAVILVPAFGLFVGLLVFAGRTAVAHQGVEAVAADAARAASIARTTQEARTNAAEAIEYALANNSLRCASSSVSVDTAGLDAAIGVPAMVSATVTCTINLADLSVPGVPGTHTVRATMHSPVDTWRQR